MSVKTKVLSDCVLLFERLESTLTLLTVYVHEKSFKS